MARSRSDAVRPTPEVFEAAEHIVQAFCDSTDASEVPITSKIRQGALVAARTYGKFVGHAADLNLGGCYAYACASASAHEARLVCKGDDFAKTDMA